MKNHKITTPHYTFRIDIIGNLKILRHIDNKTFYISGPDFQLLLDKIKKYKR